MKQVPLIGITGLELEEENGRGSHRLMSSYTDAVTAGGGLPLILPETCPEDAERYVSLVDGLLVPGGGDVSPLLYGQEPCPKVSSFRRESDLFELAVIRAAIRRGIPIFGICRGIQVINVAMGGTLIQDIPSQVPGSICHRQTTRRWELAHSVQAEPGSLLEQVTGMRRLEVNTFHHQAIDQPAPGLIVTAHAPDGVIEAVESADRKIFAVQWHPENLFSRGEEFRKLFCWLADAAKG